LNNIIIIIIIIMSSGLDEVEVGKKYQGSIVTMIDQEVVDGPKKYHIKRRISLENGALLSDEYWREKTAGGKKYESGRKSLEPTSKPKAPKDETDHRGAARAQARKMMAQRKR
jgi:hypothetical protein